MLIGTIDIFIETVLLAGALSIQGIFTASAGMQIFKKKILKK